jgi:hypothetical protein
MNLQEITNRSETSPFDQSEMVFVVEKYIEAKKGSIKRINIEKNINNSFHYIRDIYMLSSFFAVACAYFREKEKK